MKKIIRYIFFSTGFVIGLYGALKDKEPITLIGAGLIVIALMLNVILNIISPK